MEPRVASVNVGAPRRVRVAPTAPPSGIVKVPVGSITVRDPGPKRRAGDGSGCSGVEGDFIGSGRHHGGTNQAVYAVAREELDWWEGELDRELRHGAFGENLTTLGLDVDAAEIGDRWRIGAVELRVTGPRIPCSTFAARIGVRGWVRRVTDRGRLGAYLAVEVPGTIRPGDPIVVHRSGRGVTVPDVLRAWDGDADRAARVLAAGVLGDDDHAELVRRVENGRRISG